MATPTRKASDDGSPGARKRPRLSDEQATQEEQRVAQGDSFSEFFGSEIDFDDEALQMVDEYDVFQPDPSVDVTCVANSGDDQFLDGANTRGDEDEDEVPSSQGEADAGEPYTIGTIHGEYPSSSQYSVSNGSPSRKPSASSHRPPPDLPTLDEDAPKEEDIDFGAYASIPIAVGFASTSAVLSDLDMPTFMPASQVPIDKSELASTMTARSKPTKSGIKLAGGGGSLRPISVEDIKASAQKLMSYQQDTRWKPQARARKIPPPKPPAHQAINPAPAAELAELLKSSVDSKPVPLPAPLEEKEKEEDIDFGALIKPAAEFSAASMNIFYDDAMPTFMPASQVPIDRSELASSSTFSKPVKKLDVKLAGGSGALMPLTEDQIKASADKLMAYQKDTKWKPQVRARLPQAGSSSKAVSETHGGDKVTPLTDEMDVNESGTGLLESVDRPGVDYPLDSKGKGKQRETTPPVRAMPQPPSSPRNILRSMENLDDNRPETSYTTSELTQPTVESTSMPPPTLSKDLENPFSSRAHMKGTLDHRSTAPFKTPVRPSTALRYPADGVSISSVQSPLFSSSQTPLLSQAAPSTLYRLGLSQRKPKSKVPAFMTPFKPGMAPGEKGREMLDARNKSTPARASPGQNGTPTLVKGVPPSGGRAGAGISGITRALEAEKERQALERAVFDTRRIAGRKSLREAGVASSSDAKKQSVTLELNIPYLTLKAASELSFPQGGYVEALSILQERGCTLANREWAKNHWGQIVWKLAGLARTGVEETNGKWSWEEALRQMLYRYEREINRAERPAIRLIQERDASPAQAMILCVSEIRLQGNDEAEIELTDGWYRIRTVSDKSLARAAYKGKLVVGRKIAVSGARLEGGNEGKEVLKAYHSSVLKIGGNSTSLAPWDARLGFQPCPFIASLRSLTADGGLIALLDIQVTKIFPIGFVETDQTGRSSKPFDQSAEDEAQRAWEELRNNEASKWRIRFEKQLERMKAAIDKLGSTARGIDANPEASPPNQTESFIEEFEDAEFDPEVLKARRFSPTEAAWLVGAIQNKLNELYERREEVLERELMSACPPRKVRNFRVLVIKDARALRKPTGRVAQITVWDVLSFSGDSLRAGQRYLLANVQPSQPSSWRKGHDTGDIYLSTRRDTKWTVISGP